MKIAVIGLGQSLRGDDAAGLEAVRLWREQHPDSAGSVSVKLCELPGLELLDLLDGIDAAFLVDALHAAGTSGSLVRLSSEDLAAFTPDTHSAHGWGVAETLFMGKTLYPMLARCFITLIGIIGSQFNLGADLSPAVRDGLTGAAALIEKEVQSLLDQ